MLDKCPICADPIVTPYGPENSPVLLMGAYPGRVELEETGIPFTGRAGEILQTELARHGVDIWKYRMTNIWMHDSRDTEEEFNYHSTKAIQEAQNRRVVLLMGADPCSILMHKNVTDLCGLRVQCTFFPDAITVVSVNPAQALHGVIGELRNAMSEFADVLREEGLL